MSRLVKAELRATDPGTVDRWEQVVGANPFVGPERDVGALRAGWTVYFDVEEFPLDSIERFGGRIVDEREGEHGAELVALDPLGTAVGFVNVRDGPHDPTIGDIAIATLVVRELDERLIAFYRGVFGWTVLPVRERILTAYDDAQTTVSSFVAAGNVLQQAAVWLPYFYVDHARRAIERARDVGWTVLESDLLGIEPGAWLQAPVIVGDESLGSFGVVTLAGANCGRCPPGVCLEETDCPLWL